MKYVIKMMSSDTHIISEETFKKLSGKSGLLFIPEINGIINLNSVNSIMPEGTVGLNKIKLHDGGYAIKKHGTWVDERSGATMDLNHYKYLAKEQSYEEFKALL